MQHLHLIGKSLSVNEEAALQSSLPLLSKQHQEADANTTVSFWGKVEGYKKDYLIARVQIVKLHECKHVNYFSNDGGHHWSELPVISLTSNESVLCDQLRGIYIGEPQFEYKVCKSSAQISRDDNAHHMVGNTTNNSNNNEVVLPDMNDELVAAEEELKQNALKNKKLNKTRHQQQDQNQGSQQQQQQQQLQDEDEDDDDIRMQQRKWNKLKKNKKGNNNNDDDDKNSIKQVIVCIPESLRLAHFVQSHDNACRLAIRGQYLLRGHAIGEVNTRFNGHSLSHAMQLSCYMHHDYNSHKVWADPIRNKQIYGASYDPQSDYLIPISEDIPDGVWCIKYHPSINIVSVQNLLFDGSLFWYEPNTTHFGQIYYGDGQRTLDLCFTL